MLWGVHFTCYNMFRDLCQVRVIFLPLLITQLSLALAAFSTNQDIFRTFQDQVAGKSRSTLCSASSRQADLEHLPSPQGFMNIFNIVGTKIHHDLQNIILYASPKLVLLCFHAQVILSCLEISKIPKHLRRIKLSECLRQEMLLSGSELLWHSQCFFSDATQNRKSSLIFSQVATTSVNLVWVIRQHCTGISTIGYRPNLSHFQLFYRQELERCQDF